MSDLEQYSQANTCPHCGRHPGRAERLPEWITHIATCPANGRERGGRMSPEHPVTRVTREHGPIGRVALDELRKIRPAAPEEELARAVDAIADLALWTRLAIDGDAARRSAR